MKLAIVTPQFLPVKSGLVSVLSSFYGTLIKKYDYEITLYTLNQKREWPFDKKWSEEEVIDGIRVKRFDYSYLIRGYRFSLPLLKELSKRKFDIIHSHQYGFFPATAGFVSAKSHKTPHIFTPHYHPPIYGRRRWFLFSLYHVTQGLPILNFSDMVLPITNYEKIMLCKLGANDNNMKIIPNPVDTTEFVPHKVKGKTRENVVLYVSYLLENKGAHIAFDIAEQILKERRDVKFVFIGHGPLETNLKRRSRKYGKRHFLFLKNISQNELIKWYSRADVFVLPSYYEAFGLVLAEAMACETPVVSTRVGGIPEVVNDGKTGYLVDYGDWNTFKDRIIELLDNKNY
jgi:glycosyltransferase involved in cell wall biosynthesis